MPARLSALEIDRVRAEHSIVDVLTRGGIAPPERWDGASDYWISCPRPGHRDSHPSCVVHPQTDRWNCFGCGAHGDVLELVGQIEGIRTLREIAEILDARRTLHPVAAAGPVVPPRAAAAVSERPDRARTSYERVMIVNAAAWNYLSLPPLAQRGRDYLAGRGINVSALEAETHAPLVGHTPYQPDGLVNRLRRRGFTDDEIVDAGWGARRDGQLKDRFRRRLLVPVHDLTGRIVGVYGRDITGSAAQKYLNTPGTVAFHKGAVLYRPTVSALDQHATVVVCEGSLDALAIAAHAAAAGKSHYYAPVSPSGTALTDTQVVMVLTISDRPPLACADGDEPGQAAAEKWVRGLMSHGRETIVTVLPDGHDPASWLREHGPAGLCAFTRKGCLDLPAGTVKPTPAGGLLAERFLSLHIAAARRRDPDAETVTVLADAIRDLGVESAKVPDAAAAQRFAVAAGAVLARLTDGMDAAGRTRQVLQASAAHASGVVSLEVAPAERYVAR